MASMMHICSGLVGPKSENVEKVNVDKFLKVSSGARGRQAGLLLGGTSTCLEARGLGGHELKTQRKCFISIWCIYPSQSKFTLIIYDQDTCICGVSSSRAVMSNRKAALLHALSNFVLVPVCRLFEISIFIAHSHLQSATTQICCMHSALYFLDACKVKLWLPLVVKTTELFTVCSFRSVSIGLQLHKNKQKLREKIIQGVRKIENRFLGLRRYLPQSQQMKREYAVVASSDFRVCFCIEG